MEQAAFVKIHILRFESTQKNTKKIPFLILHC
jgi:hypothetical protein